MAGIQVGSAIAGYWAVFILSLVFGCLGLLYTIFFLVESNTKVKSEESTTIFDKNHVKDCWNTTFRQRKEGRRFAILVLLLSFLALVLCMNTADFDFLMTRLKFGWESSDFSNYLTVQRFSRLVSLFILLPLLTRFCKISDTLIILAGMLVTTMAYLLLCLTPISSMVFISALIQMNSITMVSLRAQLSKQVDSTEYGKIFAVVGISQSLVSLVSHAMFGGIYRLTLSYFPTTYLIIVIICLAAAFFSILLLEKFKRLWIEEEDDSMKIGQEDDRLKEEKLLEEQTS